MAASRLDRIATYQPRGQHCQMVLLRKHSAWSHGMPAHRAQMPGIARLVDAAGKVLEERSIDLMKLRGGAPQWQDRRVVLAPILDWPLPD